MRHRQLRRTASGADRQNDDDTELEDDVEWPQPRSAVPPSNAPAAAAAAAQPAASAGFESDEADTEGAAADAEGAAADAEGAAAGSTRSGSRGQSRGPVTAYTKANKNARSQLMRLFKHVDTTVRDIASKYESLAADPRISNGGTPIMGYFFVRPTRSSSVAVQLIGADAMPVGKEQEFRDILCQVGEYAQAAVQADTLLTQMAQDIQQGLSRMRASGSMSATGAAVWGTSRQRDRGGSVSRAADAAAADGDMAHGASSAAGAARDKPDRAALEPSKLDQLTARRIQSALGSSMPSSDGCCNRGCKASSTDELLTWVVLEDGNCQCGGSCAAARVTLQLPPELPMVSFQQQSAPRRIYQAWIDWAAWRLQQEGPGWVNGIMKKVLEDHRQAERDHAERIANRRAARTGASSSGTGTRSGAAPSSSRAAHHPSGVPGAAPSSSMEAEPGLSPVSGAAAATTAAAGATAAAASTAEAATAAAAAAAAAAGNSSRGASAVGSEPLVERALSAGGAAGARPQSPQLPTDTPPGSDLLHGSFGGLDFDQAATAPRAAPSSAAAAQAAAVSSAAAGAGAAGASAPSLVPAGVAGAPAVAADSTVAAAAGQDAVDEIWDDEPPPEDLGPDPVPDRTEVDLQPSAALGGSSEQDGASSSRRAATGKSRDRSRARRGGKAPSGTNTASLKRTAAAAHLAAAQTAPPLLRPRHVVEQEAAAAAAAAIAADSSGLGLRTPVARSRRTARPVARFNVTWGDHMGGILAAAAPTPNVQAAGDAGPTAAVPARLEHDREGQQQEQQRRSLRSSGRAALPPPQLGRQLQAGGSQDAAGAGRGIGGRRRGAAAERALAGRPGPCPIVVPAGQQSLVADTQGTLSAAVAGAQVHTASRQPLRQRQQNWQHAEQEMQEQPPLQCVIPPAPVWQYSDEEVEEGYDDWRERRELEMQRARQLGPEGLAARLTADCDPVVLQHCLTHQSARPQQPSPPPAAPSFLGAHRGAQNSASDSTGWKSWRGMLWLTGRQ